MVRKKNDSSEKKKRKKVGQKKVLQKHLQPLLFCYILGQNFSETFCQKLRISYSRFCCPANHQWSLEFMYREEAPKLAARRDNESMS